MELKYILLFIIGIVIAETFSQHYIKKSSIYSNYKYIIFAILFYLLVIYFLYNLYKKYRMGPVFILWSVLSTLSVYIIGHIIYNEQITYKDIIGGLLCFIGIYIVYKDSNYMN